MKKRRRHPVGVSVFVLAEDLVDLDRRIVADLETFPAVVAGLGGIEIADLALHAAVALLFVIENTFLDFHISIIVRGRKKSKDPRKKFPKS